MREVVRDGRVNSRTHNYDWYPISDTKLNSKHLHERVNGDNERVVKLSILRWNSKN